MERYHVRALRDHRNNLFNLERRLCSEANGGSPKSAEGRAALEQIEREIDTHESFLRRAAFEGSVPADEHYTTRRFAFGEFLRGVARNGPESSDVRAVELAWEGLSPELRAALNTGTGSQGGFTVPAEFDAEIVEANTNFGRIESLASYFETTGVGELDVPAVADPPTQTAAQISEAGTYPESEDTFVQYKANAYKYGTIVKASDEWVSDSGVDPVDFLSRRGGRAIQIALNTKLAVGTGTGEPQGITNNTVGVTLASGQTTSISSADSLEDLFFSVSPNYRASAVWIMADATLKAIRKLKATGSGEWVFEWSDDPSLPDTLLGRPVYSDPDMPALGAGAKTIAFGDINANLLVRRIVPPRLKVLTEPYGLNDQIGFRLDRRVDAKIVDPAAVRLLQQSAT